MQNIHFDRRYLAIVKDAENEVHFYMPGQPGIPDLQEASSVYDYFVNDGDVKNVHIGGISVKFGPEENVTDVQAVLLVHAMVGLMETAREG